MVTADQLVAAYRKWHVNVVERPGWRTRSTGHAWEPLAILVHHDAAKDTFPTEQGVALIEKGRPDLKGPLANSWNEDDGRVFLTSFGNSNNAGRISAKAFDRIRRHLPPTGDAGALGWRDDGPVGNPYFFAKEVHNAGDGRDPYEPGQMQSLTLQCAAECDLMGWDPHAAVWGHRQVTRRKIDPKGLDLAALAEAVAVCLYVGPGGSKPTPMEADMPTVIAVDLVFDPDGSGRGYKLDATGGIHPFGGAPALRSVALDNAYAQWQKSGVAPARALRMVVWGAKPGGYILDAIGGITPVGSAKDLGVTDGYWPQGFVPPRPAL